MAIEIVPCWSCDGSGQATSEFHFRMPVQPHHVQYQIETKRYSHHGWLFVDGKCRTCHGTGKVRQRVQFCASTDP